MTQKSNLVGITRSLRNRVFYAIAYLLQASPHHDAPRTAPPSDPVGPGRRNAKSSSGAWVLDIVQARMGTGRTLRIITVADEVSVFSEMACPRSDHQDFDVACRLERLCRQRGYPSAIRVNHVSKFPSRDLNRWACDNGIRLELLSPGCRIAGGSIERRLLTGSRSEGRETAPIGSLSAHIRELLAYLRRRP